MNKLKFCRNCKSSKLVSIVNLGNQSFTGIFPSTRKKKIPQGILELIKCNNCNLVQLGHSFDLNYMYGKNYGYRSSLNKSMVAHLKQKYKKLIGKFKLKKNDIILDIGSNDGTLLNFFSKKYTRIGIDPTISKFKKYYKDRDIILIDDYFSSENYFSKLTNQAKIITSISMFYDLEDPRKFVQNIHQTLDDNGVWHFEQSYLPSMIEKLSYDTICHEHLEYYDLTIIKKILKIYKIKILDVEFNDINGGSIAITAAKYGSNYKANFNLINKILRYEKNLYKNKNYFTDFKKKIFKHKSNLKKIVNKIKKENKILIGYGASTKGNVIIQFCKFSSKDIKIIADVNSDKFNHFTPGSKIKIISEKKAKLLNPDYMIVFPWHFKKMIIQKEKKFLTKLGKLIFPLPKIEIINE